jgi:hypothetical protein
MGSCLHRGPVGEPEGGSFTGTLERKRENAYLVSFLLDPEDIKIEVWGPSGTLARNRALLSWYQIVGHKGPVYMHRDP